MNTKEERVLDSGRRVVVDLKRKYSDHESICSAGAMKVTFPLDLDSVFPNSKLPKQRRLDSARGCAFSSGRRLVKYYSNFKKTGVLQRLLYHQNDEWTDFPESVVAYVSKELAKNPAVEVKVNGNRILLDFLHMMQLDLDTGLHQPIAWIDVSGNCFFPDNITDSNNQVYVEKHADDDYLSEDEHIGDSRLALHLEIQLHNLNDEFSGESDMGEPMKCFSQNAALRNYNNEICGKGVHASPIEDDKKCSLNVKLEENMNFEVTSVNRSVDFSMVKNMFFNAVKPDIAEIVSISNCKSTVLESHLEIFEKQLEITKKHRGDGNVRYAWFPCPKGTVSAIRSFGIGHYNQNKDNSFDGVLLIPANGTKFSTKNIDVDENGSRHVVLCRVIMGNMEIINSGSEQFHPSNDNFDSGVDDLQTPTRYILWSMNMNSRIYPECVVSFNVTSETEGPEIGKEPRVGASMSIPGNKRLPAQAIFPKSPWMPFPMLFASIASQVHPQRMELVRLYYGLFKNKTITRAMFITKLRVIVGDTVLKSAITGLRRMIPEASTSVVETS